MDIQLQKLELIKMLLEIQNASILESIKSIIIKNNTIEDDFDIKELLEISENQYNEKKIENYENILAQTKTKYFQK